ncbi:PadR family transcriptional regulator [Halorubrum sp. HHNYT27]|uniref:PadR family transcriptional regulator n=1 Tax=Halorubrum sp. HHNYT27 TaxID=3402275 RepID=UPI003EB80455
MPNPLFELTSFQRDLLYVISGAEKPSGQEIKKELQSSMGEITHGRLYPNLDTLVERGYIEKGESDRRTNFYELTEKGFAGLRGRREWENRYVDLPSVE